MGETAPPQAPAGSHGIGVSGVGLLGGGTVAPRLHSAIVERLRARIAVCRQHHLNCEGRYERSRAESSDRERENTLQLLTLVQHGQGTRKNSKHSKTACNAPPPDYRQHQQQQPLLRDDGGDMSGDQHHQAPNGLGQRNPALIALQGTLKRKLVVNMPSANKRSNGVSENSFLDFKKVRPTDCLAAGQSVYHGVDGVNQSHNGILQMEHALHKKSGNSASSCEANDLFNSTLKNIKNEPGENLPCGKHFDHRIAHENSYRYGEDSAEQIMDPDLQELFNEFSYISVPPMSDLELQNMINITIKQDELFNIDIDQQNQRVTSMATPLDKVVIKSEYSSCMNSSRVGSPQMRPPSTGPAFSMSGSPLTSTPSTSVPTNHGQPQVSSCQSQLNNWQELSHAQQLKQIAANRQQNLIQQQQTTNSSSSWPRVLSMGQPSRQYGLDKVQSPFRQQQLSPHGSTVSVNHQKAGNGYLYKNNSSSQSASLEMLKQDLNKNSVNTNHLPEEHHGLTKPLFHYSPESSSQQPTSGLLPQNKALLPVPEHPQQQQNSSTSQQQEQAQQVNSVAANRSGGFHQKMILSKMQQNHQVPGLQYPNVHQQQSVALASCSQSVALASCSQSVALASCSQSVALASCSQSVALASCSQSVALASCSQSVALASCSQSVALASCSQSVALASCAQSVALASCAQSVALASCSQSVTLASCSQSMTLASCSQSMTLASCSQSMTLASCSQSMTLASCSQSMTLASCSQSMTLASCSQSMTLASCSQSMTLASCSQSMTLASCSQSMTLASCSQSMTLASCSQSMTLASCSQSMTLASCSQSMTLASCSQSMTLPYCSQFPEKCNSQEQLNRHLTRPPPDYKDQRRNNVAMQQGNQFTASGVTPDPAVTNSASARISPQNPALSSRMTSPDMYGSVPCPKQNLYNNINQVQPQSSPTQMRSSPSGNVLSSQATVTPGNNVPTFGVNPTPFRPGPNHGNNPSGQRPPEPINTTTTSQKWMTPEAKRQDFVRFTNSNQFANQSVQGVMAHQHFPQRGLTLPNQGLQMSPLNQSSPANGGQSMEPLRGFNHGQNPQRSQMLTNLNQASGTSSTSTSPFNPTNQMGRSFSRSDSYNDLVSFDFISQNGGLGSSLSGDSDFIDALLKTGHNNDDWMKDINLDEIFKGHT
ncbi:mastermind-like protein 2 [Gastrophryne carolinensis]